MSDIKFLHRQAMEKTDLAIIARRGGDNKKSEQYFREALELEKQAALLLKDKIEEEPARSVLFRSAASLALDCGNPAEAEKLVCAALAGTPPESLAEELRDLLEQVYFHRHLSLRGIQLQQDEVQMSISGEGVGFGFAPTSAFLHRVSHTEKLLIRTAERKLNKPYRSAGSARKSIQEDVELYMSVPRAASFAVTFRIGSRQQIDLPGMFEGSGVIKEVLDCLDLYNQDKTDELRKRIPDEAYYKNFIGLADNLAPDGDEISLVGFTIQKQGKVHEVAMKAKTQKIKQEVIATMIEVSEGKQISHEEYVEIIGVLRFADSRKQDNNKIQIIDDGNNKHALTVPEGMMSDIVKPLWDTKVIATGLKKGQKTVLESIIPYRKKS